MRFIPFKSNVLNAYIPKQDQVLNTDITQIHTSKIVFCPYSIVLPYTIPKSHVLFLNRWKSLISQMNGMNEKKTNETPGNFFFFFGQISMTHRTLSGVTRQACEHNFINQTDLDFKHLPTNFLTHTHTHHMMWIQILSLIWSALMFIWVAFNEIINTFKTI